ncbi:MAG: hypothetical protein JNK57_21035 [Planctomycetaceae bacterium]|nr:hypothetical protein [Planctomycetaceae bacterium]
MARVVISFSGEGRGHAARTLSLVQELRGHQLLVLCPRNMLSWMQEATWHESHVQLLAIPSLNFSYDRSGKLSYVKSCLSAMPFLYHLRGYLRWLSQVVDEFNPHLAIVDFEPLLSRVTRSLGIRTLSLDHQHFLAAMDLSKLPWNLGMRARFLQPSVKLFCPTADAYLISSFYQFPQRPEASNYRQVGVLIREELGHHASHVGEHLLVYLRREHAGPWLQQLAELREPCFVYGMDRDGVEGNLYFKKISSREFIRDLVTCRSLISTAGNQLIGEALAVGKPVLAIPEYGNFEQQINGHFLQASGLGRCLLPQQVSRRAFYDFLEALPFFRERIGLRNPSGNEEVVRQIQHLITMTTPQTTFVPEVEVLPEVEVATVGAEA